MVEEIELEALWDGLLSRQPHRIRDTYQSLSRDEQRSVFAHLQRMASEAGWHPEQVISARIALEVLLVLRGASPADTP